MIFGMTPLVFVHVVISLIGIVSGLVVLYALFAAKWLEGWTRIFLVTTVATSVTGFFIPADRLLPSHIVGILSMIVLGAAIYALYGRRLAGAWRRTYVINAVIALYLNVFVLVVQLFLKVPALRAIAPTQADPPFILAQSLVLVLFVAAGAAAAIRFRGGPVK